MLLKKKLPFSFRFLVDQVCLSIKIYNCVVKVDLTSNSDLSDFANAASILVNRINFAKASDIVIITFMLEEWVQ